MELFSSYINIYLFGSILNAKKSSNDIDILLIYTEFSKNTMNDLNVISSMFAKLSKLPVDLTVLSVAELRDTDFLKRLNSKYLKLR